MTALNVAPLDIEGGQSETQIKFAAFVRDDETRAALEAAFGPESPGATVATGGIDDAVVHLAGDPSARTLVVDLSGCADSFKSLDRLAEVCRPDTVVIAVGDINDVAFYRRLRAAGVSDYLAKPVTSEAIGNALDVAFRPSPVIGKEKAAQPGGRIVAVIGARGGVGATTVATTLAWLFAEEGGRRTTLIDLDLHAGTTGLALDVEPGHGLSEALAHPDRIDSLFLSSAASRVGEKLSLLVSEEPLDYEVEVRPGALELLLKEARRDSECVVLDVPRWDPALLHRAIVPASTVLVVTDFSLAGLREAGRLLNVAKAVAPETKCLLVGNRAGANKKSALPSADIEKTLGTSFAAIVPEDGAAVLNALNTGKPLPKVARRSKTVAAFRVLARSFDSSPPASRGLLTRLVHGAGPKARERSRPKDFPKMA